MNYQPNSAEIKEQKLCENTPIIVFTANAIAGDRERYLAEGFDDFIAKPISIRELSEKILDWLPFELLEENQIC